MVLRDRAALRAADPAAVMRSALEAGHPRYVMIPGGQVFRIAALS